MTELLLLVLALPVLAGLCSWVGGRRWPDRAPLVLVWALVSSVVAAVVLARAVWVDGPVAVELTGSQGAVIAGLVVDRVGAVLLLLVTGLSAVVTVFARRYLRADDRARQFFGATGLLVGASAGIATSITLQGLALAWSLAGLALIGLLATYPDLPGARDGVRRTVRALLVGDLALWVAVLVVTVVWGTVDLRSTGPGTGWATGLVGVLLVVAALARSAQLPFHRWLPATLAAPTPVSALLHAGVVNGGGVLLVRSGGVVGQSPAAMYLAVGLGAATAVYGAVLMLVKPDVKGALALSTTAQMGFLVLTCGLGAYAAAVVHLTLHGLYKATLFLGSGAAVRNAVLAGRAPGRPVLTRTRTAAVACGAVLLPVVGLALGAGIAPGKTTPADAVVLLVLAWATGAALALGWLRRFPTVLGALGVLAGSMIVLPLHLVATSWLAGGLSTATPDPVHTPEPWVLVGPAIVLVAAAVVRLAPVTSRFAGLHRTVYVLALRPGGTRSGRGPRDRSHDPAPSRYWTAMSAPSSSEVVSGARS